MPRACFIYLRLTGHPLLKIASPNIYLSACLLLTIKVCFSSLRRCWCLFFF